MKKAYFVLILVLSALIISICNTSCSSDDNEKPELKTHYFRFMSCSESNHGNWQDTTFIAATNRLEVIEQCLNELSLPIDERRKFPLGNIANGSNGYNRNASHYFTWHFIEDSWEMVDLGIEIYDGCAYTHAELGNYVEIFGAYGGWGNQIIEEIEIPE